MIKERIIQIVEIKGIKKEDFYKNIGMTSANFRGKAKETPINSNAIVNILSNIPEINLYWLLTGEGEMFNNIKQNENNFDEINLNTIKTIINILNKDCLNREEKNALKSILDNVKQDLLSISNKIDNIDK